MVHVAVMIRRPLLTKEHLDQCTFKMVVAPISFLSSVGFISCMKEDVQCKMQQKDGF